MTSLGGLMRACRFREGTHRVAITVEDCKLAQWEFGDFSPREVIDESLRAQHADELHRGWILALAARRRYTRQLQEARRAA